MVLGSRASPGFVSHNSCLSPEQEVHKTATPGRNAAESGSSGADWSGVDGVWAGLGRAGSVRRVAVIPKWNKSQLHLNSGPPGQWGTCWQADPKHTQTRLLLRESEIISDRLMCFIEFCIKCERSVTFWAVYVHLRLPFILQWTLQNYIIAN